jgi:hypothetical protein
LADRPDPRLDKDGRFALLLQRQLRGYSSTDPPIRPQVAMTASMLRQFYSASVSDFDKALCDLFIGAFFFAMRSCEYIKVSGPRKTKLLLVHNIKFYRGRRVLPHSDPLLHRADCVSITFDFQKRDSKGDVITQHRCSDPLLCPVKVWARIIRRLTSYQSTSPTTQVNTYIHPDGSTHYFSGKDLLSRIRLAAATLGEDELGFSPDQVGLHSARSGAAMAMYLAGVPVVTIMLLGRWSSDAFLRYIRRQVKEFSGGVSQKMISNERFFTISSIQNNITEDRPLTSKFGPTSFKDTIKPLVNAFR